MLTYKVRLKIYEDGKEVLDTISPRKGHIYHLVQVGRYHKPRYSVPGLLKDKYQKGNKMKKMAVVGLIICILGFFGALGLINEDPLTGLLGVIIYLYFGIFSAIIYSREKQPTYK